MPVTPTYPGVYIEEVPSAVRTITGVATSITAFVGRAKRGPIDEPRRISSWGDYERLYGGLWFDSTMSYAVQQYFMNGGTDAVIVRLALTGPAAQARVPKGSAATPARLALGGPEVWKFRATRAVPEGQDVSIAIGHGPSETEFIIDITVVDLSPSTYPVDVAELAADPSSWPSNAVVVDGPIPSLRPNVTAKTKLEGGRPSAYAFAVLEYPNAPNPQAIRAAVRGAGGNRLFATVEDAQNGARYDLRIELLDDDGDVIAATLYKNVTAGSNWPRSPELTGTDVTLIATTEESGFDKTPAERPVNTVGRVAFEGGSDHVAAKLDVGVTLSELDLEAANPGTWGNRLRIAIDYNTKSVGLFNLLVGEDDGAGNVVVFETFLNLSIHPTDPRDVQKVIAEESSRVVLKQRPASLPLETLDKTQVPPRRFFKSFEHGDDGDELDAADYIGSKEEKTGLYRLEMTDLFNLLVIPPPGQGSDTPLDVWTNALTYCKARRAMLLVDAPTGWSEKDSVIKATFRTEFQADAVNAALYWPHIKMADPLREHRLESFPPSGAVAGLIARTDAQRGVWKAPAGIDASVTGARGLAASITDQEHGEINPLGINVIRSFPNVGTVVWGARTLRGADMFASEWKYLPVRRLALMIEESLYRGTQWAVFEGNDEPLWAQLRLNIGAFMHDLFRKGAFQGKSPREAYLVKCDAETTTQSDIDRGIVNVVVGFRPLKPAEFVMLKISQLAGQAGA